jgi:hypothetical protein
MISTDKVNEERKGPTNKVWRAYLSEYKVLKAEKNWKPQEKRRHEETECEDKKE